MSGSESKGSFFRQSGWMVMTTVAGGVFMTSVHFLAPSMGTSEYAVFCTLLRIYLLLGIPAAGLQTIFAQQGAAAYTEERTRELVSATRAFIVWTFLAWLVMSLGVFAVSGPILKGLKIANPWALWLTLGLGLAALWTPIIRGLLQGRQDFASLGWTLILDGFGRFIAVAVLVVVLNGHAASGIGGALIGQTLAIGVGAWMTRRIWLGAGSTFIMRDWLRRVIPLSLGSGVIICMQSADIIFVQSIYDKVNAFYVAGAQIGFALIQFIMPLAVVMFPKIAKSAAQAQKTDALRMTLVASAILGGLAAVACTLLPALPLKVLYFRKPELVQAAPLVPWFAWCLLLVAMANVLVSNLLARDRFSGVPWFVLITGAYIATLLYFSPGLVAMEPFAAFRRIVQIMGGFSLLLFIVAAWFNWRSPQSQPRPGRLTD